MNGPIGSRFRSSGPTSRSAPWSTPGPGSIRQAAVAGVSPARLKRFFVKTESGYQIQKSVRDLCVFARHDLSKDPPFSRLDLISCRNVLIYMGQALQKRVLSMFQYALKPGGFLFLGNSESISAYSDAFTVEDRKHRIFVRKPAALRVSRIPPGHRTSRESRAPSSAKSCRAECGNRFPEGSRRGCCWSSMRRPR